MDTSHCGSIRQRNRRPTRFLSCGPGGARACLPPQHFSPLASLPLSLWTAAASSFPSLCYIIGADRCVPRHIPCPPRGPARSSRVAPPPARRRVLGLPPCASHPRLCAGSGGGSRSCNTRAITQNHNDREPAVMVSKSSPAADDWGVVLPFDWRLRCCCCSSTSSRPRSKYPPMCVDAPAELRERRRARGPRACSP